jgi:hypothetical protein
MPRTHHVQRTTHGAIIQCWTLWESCSGWSRHTLQVRCKVFLPTVGSCAQVPRLHTTIHQEPRNTETCIVYSFCTACFEELLGNVVSVHTARHLTVVGAHYMISRNVVTYVLSVTLYKVSRRSSPFQRACTRGAQPSKNSALAIKAAAGPTIPLAMPFSITRL